MNRDNRHARCDEPTLRFGSFDLSGRPFVRCGNSSHGLEADLLAA